jgi:WD40 repeat protein
MSSSSSVQVPSYLLQDQMDISIPTGVIIDHILPFCDRPTWNSLILACRDIYQASSQLKLSTALLYPPWPQGTFEMGQLSTKVCFSYDGSFLCCQGSDDRVHVWHPRVGPYAVLETDLTAVDCIDCSPIENILATIDSIGGLRLWDLESLTVIQEIDVVYRMLSCQFSPDGTKLACSGRAEQKTVRIYQISSGLCLHALTGWGPTDAWVGVTVFSPDGSQVAAPCDGRVLRIWKLNKNGDGDGGDPNTEPVVEAEDVLLVIDDVSRALGVVFGRDGNSFATRKENGVLQLFRRRKYGDESWFPARQWRAHAQEITDILYYDDSSRIATAGMDCTVRLWDADSNTCMPLCKYATGGNPVYSIAVSPNGRTLACGSTDTSLRLYTI